MKEKEVSKEQGNNCCLPVREGILKCPINGTGKESKQEEKGVEERPQEEIDIDRCLTDIVGYELCYFNENQLSGYNNLCKIISILERKSAYSECIGEVEGELRKVFSDNYLFGHSRIYRHSMLQEDIKDIISESLQKIRKQKLKEKSK